MIKLNRTIALVACLLSTSAYQTTQAGNLSAIVAGSVIATSGFLFTTVQTVVALNEVNMLRAKDTHWYELEAYNVNVSRRMLASIATTAVGIGLISYGISK
jgi:hypothetical protein